MATTLETLLAPVSTDDPAGPDLAYDPQRHEIEQAFESPVSIDASGVADSRSDVDWRAITAAIVDQAKRTKDVWIPIYLCRAGARTGDLRTVALGAEGLAATLETYWDIAHPRLDDYGFQGRKGACDTLASHREFVGPLGRVTLVSHDRLGRFSADDLARFHRGGDGADGYGMFRAAIDEGALDTLAEAVALLDAVEASLRRADTVLVANAGAESGTNFAPVYEALAGYRAAAVAFLPQAADQAEAGEEIAGGAPAGARMEGGAIRNREEVIRAIDRIVEYYRRAEPGSPVPLLLERARTLVPLDFLAMIEEIAPSAFNETQALLRGRPRG